MPARNRKLILGAAVLVLAAAGGVGYWYATRPAPPDPPAVPEEVTDPAVRAALTEARDAVLKEPRSADAWGEYGLTLRAHERGPEAKACFAQAARLDPDNPRWPYFVGLANLRIDPSDVVPHLREALRLATAPELRSPARLRLAEVLLDENQLDEAEQLFREELKENPGSSRAAFGLGAAAMARGDPQAAISRLEQAARNPAARKKTAALLAAAFRRLGNLAAAAKHEQEAARAPADTAWPDPFMAEFLRKQTGWYARLQQAEELDAQGKFREALGVYEDLAHAYPDEPALVKLGVAQAKAGEFPRAEQTFRSVLRQNPDNGSAHFFLGLSLVSQVGPSQDDARAKAVLEEAVTELKRAVELRPEHARAYVFLGQALMRLRRLPEAEAACRDAVRISPQEATAHLTLGEVLIAAGRPADAIPVLEEAARLAPLRDPRPRALLDKAKAAAGVK